MIAIKKLAIGLLAILILTLIVVITIAFVYGDKSPKISTNADPSITLAVNDEDVQWELAHNNVQLITESKPFTSGKIKGFLNYSHNMTAVHVILRSPSVPPPDYNYYFIVDTDRGQIVDKTSFFDVMAGYDYITLPAGAAWYYHISGIAMTPVYPGRGTPNQSLVYVYAEYSPDNATVYQEIVDEQGFEKLMNAPARTLLQDVDVRVNSVAFNGTLPHSSGWNGTVSMPAVEVRTPYSSSPSYAPNGSYYLIFINGEKDRTVNLTLRTPPSGTIYY